MTAPDLVPAVGGDHAVPRPDPVAQDYLLLALRLGQHIDGLVDGYFGPAEIKAEAEIGALREPVRLADDARSLRGRLVREVDQPDRALWLDRQLLALETLAAARAGERVAYHDEVARCFDAVPERLSRDVYASVRSALEVLLPGAGELRQRLVAWADRFIIPVERLSAAVDWLLPRLREASARHFPAPDGESLRVSLVTGQAWSGYNWYDGNLRSRVDINTDLPIRAAELIATLCHETFPGHHLEHASKEARLVHQQGRLEASVLLINTPECYVSEGLAELGRRYAFDDESLVELLAALHVQAGIAADRSDAERQLAISRETHRLRGAGADAALMLHEQGLTRPAILRFLEEEALQRPDTARKRLDFISHPLWRTYIFSYSGGELLLARWCEAADPASGRPDPVARFRRLLTEQLTPSGIAGDLPDAATAV